MAKIVINKPGKPRFNPSSKTRRDQLVTGFEKLWDQLFTTPVHLDSALSKQPVHLKSALAQIVSSILLRPASQAEAFGIGLGPDEPWSLSRPSLSHWRTARLIAERMYELMAQRPAPALPMDEDFPPEMVRAWKASWGDGITRKLVEELGREPPLGLRASRALGAASLLQELKKDSALPVALECSKVSPFGVQLAGYAPVLKTDVYQSGGFEIQDEGSQLMALFALWPDLFASQLQREPGPAKLREKFPAIPASPPAWTVVDACAGAGGKTLALADALGGKGRVFAYDTSLKKLQALSRRGTRAGLNNIQSVQVTEGSESEVVRKFRRRADVVLVDAPCSGWGVLRRNPDIKWRQSSETLTKMPEIQFRLLGEYSELVGPQGRLVFGVCTFRPEETRDVVKRFLDAHPAFEAGAGGYVGPGPCDGFFMQEFRRRKAET